MSDNEPNKEKKVLKIIQPKEATQDTNYLEEILDTMGNKFVEEYELAQGRSNFQIEKFMGLNDFTLSSQYKHILKNAAIMRRELFRVIKEGIEAKREFELKWESPEGKEAREHNKPIQWPNHDGTLKYCWYDTDAFQRQVNEQELAISIKDKVQQLDTFDQILDAIVERNGGPITKEQFDQEESQYWLLRFEKQIADELLSRATGINVGNLESVRNASAPVLIPGSPNQVNNFIDPKHIFENPMKYIEMVHDRLGKNYDMLSGNTDNVQKIEDNSCEEKIEIELPKETFNLDSLGISAKKDENK